SDPNPYYENCTFSGNTASKRGGGVQNDVATHPTFVNCRFYDNVCDAKGGGMYNDFYCSPLLTNCVFAGNYSIMAGALGNDGTSSPTLSHCVFANNEAWDKGAAIYNGSHSAAASANLPTIINCISFGNKITTAPGPTDLEVWHDNFADITYSIIEEGYAGIGNLSADPRFADVANYDLTLLSGSPAIDAGSNAGSGSEDIDGLSRPLDGDNDGSAVVDMGAHEYINAASDTDGDGMLDEWEVEYGYSPIAAENGLADSDGDGIADADESIADTDPFDTNSLFRITAFASASGTNQIIATASARRQYSLLVSTNLTTGGWTVDSNQLDRAGSADGVEFHHMPETDPLFYRVRVSVP
ncbi:choice-of-anchor Q domain-containing protein, partial [Pontiella sp.]|uniref:choice-of-anchor Q domain-containing protein n=1 Tax=Pontiella sp. TaxID=2837462 RepID=UPI0035613B4F